jgi:hypothetical protein
MQQEEECRGQDEWHEELGVELYIDAARPQACTYRHRAPAASGVWRPEPRVYLGSEFVGGASLSGRSDTDGPINDGLSDELYRFTET